MNSTTAAKTVQVRGREYTVTTQQGAQGTQYILSGKRGAVYGTMRNQKHPHMMFLVSGRGFATPAGMDGVWLTDEGGELREVGAW